MLNFFLLSFSFCPSPSSSSPLPHRSLSHPCRRAWWSSSLYLTVLSGRQDQPGGPGLLCILLFVVGLQWSYCFVVLVWLFSCSSVVVLLSSRGKNSWPWSCLPVSWPRAPHAYIQRYSGCLQGQLWVNLTKVSKAITLSSLLAPKNIFSTSFYE